MDALILAMTLLGVFALAALAAGEESRDGFDRGDPGRSIGR
jgi:hypothetical protein